MIRRGIPEIGVNLKTPDYLGLGRAFGCHVASPQSHEELGAAITRALSADGPTLIEVRQDSAYLA
jgi:thiamine pyrophosphate-dependent acetolactate synthase large subunit-like protein